jgi:hypothetical protein
MEAKISDKIAQPKMKNEAKKSDYKRLNGKYFMKNTRSMFFL